MTVRDRLRSILDTPRKFFDDADENPRATLWRLARALLMTEAPWLDSNIFRRTQAVVDILEDVAVDACDDWIARACAFLQTLNLARGSVATHTHGVAFMFVYKNHVAPGHPQSVLYTNLLGEFEISVATYRSYPLEFIREEKPRHASEARTFLSVADDAVGASTLVAHAYRNAASEFDSCRRRQCNPLSRTYTTRGQSRARNHTCATMPFVSFDTAALQ